MEWRTVTVTGEYDFENQVAMRNQYNDTEYGYHLIAPLIFSNGKAVLLTEAGFPRMETPLHKIGKNTTSWVRSKSRGRFGLGRRNQLSAESQTRRQIISMCGII